MTDAVLFYDGGCGLCHAFVKFVLLHDKRGSLKFAPLHGRTFNERLTPQSREKLPDSLVLLGSDGSIRVKSAAAVAGLKYLGGFWKLIGAALELIPAVLRDRAYVFIAKLRSKISKRPVSVCPEVPAELKPRLLP